MSQIEEAFREFIESGVDPFGDAERKADRIAISAVHDPTLPMDERISALRRWWWQYSVARNLREGEHEAVARSLIEHFDGKQTEQMNSGPDIAKEFETLEHIAKEHRLPEFSSRAVTSLVSKTLWLFYPDEAPMYDGYALGALRVLSRLYKFPVDTQASRFAQFFQAWRTGYSQVEALIPQDTSMPHKVRVFDAFLWWLGQGTFETIDND